MPWPTVKGKRCLDVGSGDAVMASELERRGAAEVVALEVDDLDPSEVGLFDVVVCRDLLWRVGDPRRALDSVRSVTSGLLLSSEPIDLWTTVFGRGRPRYTSGGGNAAAHIRMLQSAGFEIEQKSKPFVVEFDAPVPPSRSARERLERFAIRFLTKQSKPGVLHRAVLCRVRA